jgi:hypothetical protein
VIIPSFAKKDAVQGAGYVEAGLARQGNVMSDSALFIKE